MLMLPFNVGMQTYVIDCDSVVEIVPRVQLKKIPHVPDYTVGMLNFGGVPVPVIDMSQLIEGRPSASCLHTRIVILSHSTETGETYHLGIVGEKITDTIEKEKSQFIDSGVKVRELPFLGGVYNDNHESMQLINVSELFQSIQGILFK